MNKEKIKSVINTGLNILIIASSAYAVGYIIGSRNTELAIDRGLKTVLDTDPELEEHLWNATGKVITNMRKGMLPK